MTFPLFRPGPSAATRSPLSAACSTSPAHPHCASRCCACSGPRLSRLILDLSLVSHIDASGLAVLVGTDRRARLLGGSLRLAAVRPAVSIAVRAAGLDRLLEIFPSVQSAVHSPART